MAVPEKLSADQVYRRCPLQRLTFETTESLPDLALPWGQEGAMRALEFGTGIDNSGFNLFVLAPRGLRSRALVQDFLARKAMRSPTPPDWCYVYNFDDHDRPQALRLPAGEGRRFRADLEFLVDELRGSVQAIFESEEYQTRLSELQETFDRKQQEGIDAIGEEAAAADIALISSPGGFTLAPMHDGDVLEPEEYEKLDADQRQRIEDRISDLQKKLQQVIQQIPRLRKTFRKQVRALNEEMVQFALAGPMSELKARWGGLEDVVAHLDRICADVVENATAFRGGRGGGPPEELLVRYRGNLLVDNGELSGAPVIHEDLPNHHHLVGRIEHQVRQGALHTDFSMIRAGSLHRANGGYLLIDARRILSHPMAWETLKRVLGSGEIRIESLEHLYGLVSTTNLEPAPIPLSLKVVLVGERMLYYLLTRYDPDFGELFKVQADFEDDLERNDDDSLLHARMLATLARDAGTRPLHRDAVAGLIEHASRLADDQERLTARDRVLRDILMEADHWAAEAGAALVEAEHLEQALTERRVRAERVRRRALNSIGRGFLKVDVSGAVIGQVNGLAVSRLGDLSFGLPLRITATARPGKGQVIDIERESKLGGPVHSKAVMILSRYIASRYAADAELSLSASLAFEQSYGGVDGDSASVAEILALLSAIARVPLQQQFAVTGSVNQLGEVQAVGGVNEKIEGFFDACLELGDLGGQGVLLPASNVSQLMLRADVRAAIDRGVFHVYPIENVDQALALLSGWSPGQADADGVYPDGCFNRRVAERLAAFAKVGRSTRGNGAGSNSNDP